MASRRVGLWLIGAFGGVGRPSRSASGAGPRGLDNDDRAWSPPCRSSTASTWPGRATSSSAGTTSGKGFRRVGRGIPRTRGSSTPSGSPPAATNCAACLGPRPPRDVLGAGAAIAGSATCRTCSRDGRRAEAVDRIAADLAAFRGRADRSPDRPQRRQHRAPLRDRRRPPELGPPERALDGGPELPPASSLYA